jgi:hypothetical protein
VTSLKMTDMMYIYLVFYLEHLWVFFTAYWSLVLVNGDEFVGNQ